MNRLFFSLLLSFTPLSVYAVDRCAQLLSERVQFGSAPPDFLDVVLVTSSDGTSRTFDRTNRSLEDFQELIPELLDSNFFEGKTFLDLGAGDGQLVLDLNAKRTKSAKIVGVDIALRDWQKEDKYREIFIEADAGKLPFRDSSVDFVFSWQSVISYHKDLYGSAEDRQIWDTVLGEISRILTPDGQVITNFSPSKKSRDIALEIIRKNGFNAEFRKRPYTFDILILHKAVHSAIK